MIIPPTQGRFVSSLPSYRAVGLALFCLAIGLVCGCERTAQAPTVPVDSAATGTVTIEFAIDGKPSQSAVVEDVAAGTTLETVMRGLESPAMDLGGSGTTAFVNSIDGVKTDASRGWTFTVDEEFSNTGIGTTELNPPTTIRWKFTSFEEAMGE